MTRLRTPRTHRLLAAVTASLLVAATAVAIDRSPGARPDDTAAPLGGTAPSPERSGEPSPLPSVGPSPPVQVTGVLADPGTAAAVGAEGLLAAGLAAAQGPWRDLGHAAWPSRDERPVYVADVSVSPAGDAIEADLVIATRVTEPTDTIVLRALPAAAALGDGADLQVSATVDGAPTEVVIDRAGARLLVALPRTRDTGDPVLLRLAVTYRLVAPHAIVDDGGPAAFGLLAAHPDVSTLGHWLPLLTIPGDAGAMVAWGDVGAFPAAVWSLQVVHDGVLVTGGKDEPCPGDTARTCTWSRGIALRDDSAVLYPATPVSAEFALAGTTYRAFSPSGSPAATTAVLDETVAAADAYTTRFGELAWSEVDTVSVPLGRGAAGMEFPGLSLIDDEQWTNLGGAFGTAVIAHEVAHQWFHALVGSGSLSAPVVDESLAQYLTFLYWRDTFGDRAAEAFASDAFVGRYEEARDDGVADEPPGQPLAAFDGAGSYGPLVYARAPLAWVVAEEEVGVDVVESFLDQLVQRHGLAFVDDQQLVAEAVELDPALGRILERFWLDPAPID